MTTPEPPNQIRDEIRQSFELQRWQIDAIAKGVADADRGDFASDEEVAAIFAKWSREE